MNEQHNRIIVRLGFESAFRSPFPSPVCGVGGWGGGGRGWGGGALPTSLTRCHCAHQSPRAVLRPPLPANECLNTTLTTYDRCTCMVEFGLVKYLKKILI